MSFFMQAWWSGGYSEMPWVVAASRANLAAVKRVTGVRPSLSSSFLGPCVDDMSITEPSTADAIPLLLLEVLPVFFDVLSEASVDKIPSVMELTSVREFLLELKLSAMVGTPVVMLDDDDEFPDCDVFARFAGGSTLTLYIPSLSWLDARVALDGKLMVSATVSLLKVKSFWITISISILGTGAVDTAGGSC